MRPGMPYRRDAGFTLLGVLVAFTILLVGIAGIVTAFSSGLTLEREGALAFDSHYLLEELAPTIKAELRERVARGESGQIEIRRRDVLTRPGLAYEATAIQAQGDRLGQGYLVKIDIVSQSPRGERRTSLDWVPMILGPSPEDLARKMMGSN